VDQEARVDATLGIGAVAQQVEVNSTAILLQTEDSVNGSVIDSEKLKQLPTNSRNFWQVAQLDPNVSPTASGDSLANRGGLSWPAFPLRITITCLMDRTTTTGQRGSPPCVPRWTRFRNSAFSLVKRRPSTGAGTAARWC